MLHCLHCSITSVHSVSQAMLRLPLLSLGYTPCTSPKEDLRLDRPQTCPRHGWSCQTAVGQDDEPRVIAETRAIIERHYLEDLQQKDAESAHFALIVGYRVPRPHLMCHPITCFEEESEEETESGDESDDEFLGNHKKCWFVMCGTPR